MLWWYYFMFWFLKMYLYIFQIISLFSFGCSFDDLWPDHLWYGKPSLQLPWYTFHILFIVSAVLLYMYVAQILLLYHIFYFFLSFSEFFYRHSQSFIGIFPRSWYCPEWCHCGTCLTQETSATFEATDNSSGKSFDNDKWFLEYVQKSWILWKCRLFWQLLHNIISISFWIIYTII